MTTAPRSTVWPRRLLALTGACVTALGLIVLAGWHTRTLALIQIRPTFALMYYNTALSFVLSGIGLLAIARRWFVVTCGVSGVVTALGLATCSQYAFGVDLGIDQLLMADFIALSGVPPGRMALTTAGGFACSGVALCLLSGSVGQTRGSRFQTSSSGILGVMAVTLGVTTLCMYGMNLMAAYGWGYVAQAMAVHTAVGLVMVGSGILAGVWQAQGTTDEASFWLPAAVGAAIVLATILVCQALLVREQRALTHTVQATAVQVKNELTARMEARIQALIRMRQRWEAQPPAQVDWEAEVARYLRDFPGYQALAWIDASFHVRWIAPLAGNEAALGLNAASEERRRTALAAARDQRTVQVTRLFELAQGGNGFAIYLPLFPQGEFAGALRAAFRVQTLFDTILADIAPGYSVRLTVAGEPFYYRPASAEDNAAALLWRQDIAVTLPGITWQLQVWPQPATLAQHRSALPQTVFTFGLLFASVLAYSVFLTQRARAQARHLTQEVRDRHHAEAELHTLNAELDQRVQERTADLERINTALQTEITARQRAEQHLRERVEELETLLDLLPVAVWQAHDPACTYVTSNQAGYKLLRMSPGTNVSSSASPSERPPHYSMYRADETAVSSADLPLQYAGIHGVAVPGADFICRFADGTETYVYGTARPLFNAQGQVRGSLGVFLDITARKQAEEALAEHARLLARTHGDLRQIAYITAHDLQEPVRQVSVYTQKIAKRYQGSFDAATSEAVGFIVEAAQRMVAQLNDLMHYLEIDETSAEWSPTDCEVVLQRALEHVRAQITTSDATVTHDPLPTIDANAAHLQLVFQELLDNAVKFCDSAPPRVHLWAEREVQGWRFAVRDHGIGIDPQYYGKLFGLFKRVERDRYPGTGIGLAICKKIVERYGGGIWLEPTPGGGVTVIFVITDMKGGKKQR